MAGDVKVSADVESAEIQAVVYRCQHSEVCIADGRERPCSECVAQQLGVISYYHRNPIKRLRWKLRQLFKRT